ncbi:unnamed protein product [Pleuronectes platessa]|uniref:Uncharacterized protein n=1 Tax=Pleuronectes platessa TaxID=8262 RepID=A0A9N7VSC3_PLEPL|nr:unnamed protein product [Pleuronectes platessa]
MVEVPTTGSVPLFTTDCGLFPKAGYHSYRSDPPWDRQCEGTARTVVKSTFTLEDDKGTKKDGREQEHDRTQVGVSQSKSQWGSEVKDEAQSDFSNLFSDPTTPSGEWQPVDGEMPTMLHS